MTPSPFASTKFSPNFPPNMHPPASHPPNVNYTFSTLSAGDYQASKRVKRSNSGSSILSVTPTSMSPILTSPRISPRYNVLHNIPSSGISSFPPPHPTSIYPTYSSQPCSTQTYSYQPSFFPSPPQTSSANNESPTNPHSSPSPIIQTSPLRASSSSAPTPPVNSFSPIDSSYSQISASYDHPGHNALYTSLPGRQMEGHISTSGFPGVYDDPLGFNVSNQFSSRSSYLHEAQNGIPGNSTGETYSTTSSPRVINQITSSANFQGQSNEARHSTSPHQS
jgi:hypothetical protein